jgi:hypothetical protein
MTVVAGAQGNHTTNAGMKGNRMNHPFRNFLLILGASLLSAVVGGLFGAAIALLSPEFVSGLFTRNPVGLIRYAAAVGAIWGVFIGAAAMALALWVAATSNRPRAKSKSEQT